MERVSKIDNKERLNYSIFDNIKNDICKIKGRKAVLWGEGKAAATVHLALNFLGISVEFYVDNNLYRWGETFLSKDIFPPKKISGLKSEYFIFICSVAQYESIKKAAIEKYGFADEDISCPYRVEESYLIYNYKKYYVDQEIHFDENIKEIVGVWMKDYLNKCDKGVMLDFGCGAGTYSEFFAKYCKKLICCDINSEALRLCKRRFDYFFDGDCEIKYVLNDLESISCPDHSVDSIYSISTFTNIKKEYQNRYLSEFKRILKPKKIAFISFPNTNSMSDVEFNFYTSCGMPTNEELFDSIKCAGFEILSVNYGSRGDIESAIGNVIIKS